MSNHIDFYLPELKSLALPPATVSIFVDGMLCPALEPLEIISSGWPEFSRARLKYNPVLYMGGSFIQPEEIETLFAMGKSVSICVPYNGAAPGAAVLSYPIFEGHIEGIETKLQADDETIEIVATDFSANLRRVTVFGQRLTNSDGNTVFLEGFDTIFNPDGKFNANKLPIRVNGKSYTTFCVKISQSKPWSYAEAIYYLLSEYLPVGCLHIPQLSRLQTLTGNQTVRDLDVTGLNLLEALHRCCERIGLKFKFVPMMNPDRPSQTIVFYNYNFSRTVEMDCQKAGQTLNLSRTNIVALNSKKYFWPVTHKYIGLGDFKIYEATFELKMAWDSSLESNGYDYFSPSTNPDFYQVRNVYRKWTLNEAGDYSGPPYYQGDAFDFSKIFQSRHYVSRRRRFWPALTTDSHGRSLGYYLQVSYNNGLTWLQYLDAFNILTDECGIWLSGERLGTELWDALLKGGLRFRITASVISDEKLHVVVADGPVDSIAPVVEHILTLPRQYKYCKVSNQSIFAGNTDPTLGVSNEVDDSKALYEYVRKAAQTTSQIIEITDIQTPYLSIHYQPGDKVTTGPDGRDLLSTRKDNRSLCWIERVHMDFQKQCTNLKIIRKRKL
jgi:hypothetical protein